MSKLVIEPAGGGGGQSKRQYPFGEHLVDPATFADEGGMESLVPGACLETESYPVKQTGL
jgi:hypothetical protein